MVREWMEEIFTFFKSGKYNFDISCSLGSGLRCVCRGGKVWSYYLLPKRWLICTVWLHPTEIFTFMLFHITGDCPTHIYFCSFVFFIRDICQIRQYLLQSCRTSTPNLCETSSCTCGSCWAAGNKPMADPRSQILFSSPVPGIFTPCCELDCSSMGGRGTAGSVCEICVFRWIVKNNTQRQNSNSVAAAMLHVCLHLMPLNLIICDCYI